MTTALHTVKLAPVIAQTKVLNGAEGIVQAIVNVTGNIDSDGDVVVPGAHDAGRVIPKGVWHHDWHTPIAKTLADGEVFPGDPSLPTDLLMEGLGGRRVQMQFNMDDPEAVKHFGRVNFYGDEQEWSVGYDVRNAVLGAELSLAMLEHPKAIEWWNTKGALLAAEAPAVRFIIDWDVYEYSPVLFGSNRLARTEGVKSKGARDDRLDGIERELERIVVVLGSKDLGVDLTAVLDTTKDPDATEQALIDLETAVAYLYGEGVKSLTGDTATRVQNIVSALAVLAAAEDDERDDQADDDDAGTGDDPEGGDDEGGTGDSEGEGEGDGEPGEGDGGDADAGGTGEAGGDDAAPQGLDTADLMEYEMLRAGID